ncbi:MAG: DUF1735 domain-containing protein, partial [Bacteroidales bacterium]|nr:DUF1735 domain-containing protein [Bacteroidales bacterium]
MKYIKSLRNGLILFSVFILGSLSFSCKQNLDVAVINENKYENNKDAKAYMLNGNGRSTSDSITFSGTDSTAFSIRLSSPVSSTASFEVKYDKSVLDDYNNEHSSEFVALPESLVSIGKEMSVVSGKSCSDSSYVVYKTSEELLKSGLYVIPLRAECSSKNVDMSVEKSKFLLFVRDLSKLPNCNKSTGIKIISCMEVNDTNPLNNLCFTLASNGKPLIDMVILFSANINYDDETGRVYIYNNENVQHLLDNKEKYLKPLQDRGIKVVLGILGNHDRSGVANLSDEAARQFAMDEKAICEAYDLDGIFFDDEYSSYQTPVPPGFVEPSSKAASRLCYETKKAMPDKLVCVYVYSRTSSLPDVDGHESGTFVDYGIHDYGGSFDLSSNYPGMPKSRMALYSEEFSRDRFSSAYNLQSLRDNGYGAHMIFAMDPSRSNFGNQLSAMQRI